MSVSLVGDIAGEPSWSVEQVRKGGDATIYAYVHTGVVDRDQAATAARRDLFSYAVVDAYAAMFRRAGYGDAIDEVRARHAARDRDGAIAAISDAMVDEIQIMGDGDRVRDAVQAYVDAGVQVPVVFPLPWADDRVAAIQATLEAARPV